MSPPADSDKDFFADLDEDLGDDWESAFQAEDFMFSPEDETSNFFLTDEAHPEDNDEIASLMDEAKEGEQKKQDGAPAEAADSTLKGKAALLVTAATSLPSFVRQLPLYQKGLLATVPLLLIACLVLLVSGPSEPESPDTAEAPATPGQHLAQQETEPQAKEQKQVLVEAAVSPEPPPAVIPTIRQKWPLHSFFILTEGDDKEKLVVGIDLTVIAMVEEDIPLSDEQRVFLRDAIYQFYRNRPPYEIKRYALARGDMIHQLTAWLKKQWPGSPIKTVIFSRYHVSGASEA